MTSTAPNNFTWPHEKSLNAKAPVTRELARELCRNANHLIIRINNSDGAAEGLTPEGGLAGHTHSGGGDGFVMCRPLDTRVQRIVQPHEAASLDEVRSRAVINRYLEYNDENEWEDMLALTATGGNIGITPFLPGLLVSPGVNFVGVKLAYHIMCDTKPFNRHIASVRIGARECGGGAFVYGEPAALYSYNYISDDTLGAPLAAELGVLQRPANYDDWDAAKAKMADVSLITAKGESRLCDINLQVQRIYGDDDEGLRNALLLVWGYTLFEAHEYFSV